jgi:hypothetical protein
MRNILTIAVITIVLGLSLSVFFLARENTNLQEKQNFLEEKYSALSDSFAELSKKNTYAINFNPNVKTRTTSAFGSNKNITVNYYFTMDGATIAVDKDTAVTQSKR